MRNTQGAVKSVLSSTGTFIQKNLTVIQSIRPLIGLARMVYYFLNGKPTPSFECPLSETRANVYSPENYFKLLILVPPAWTSSERDWLPGTGNYFYDLWKSAEEIYGEGAVSYIETPQNDNHWIRKTVDQIGKIKPSHLLIHSEDIPGGKLTEFTELAKTLASEFSGQITLLMYDSIYWNHLFIAETFAAIFPRTSVIATDTYPRALRIARRSGPAPLPTSQESLHLLETEFTSINSDTKDFGVTLIGKVYGYRQRKLGFVKLFRIPINVNPHKSFISTGQPDFKEYYAAFRKSAATVNFARANGSQVKHAKTRILEATLFGSILITDERKLTSSLIPRESFVYFRNILDLKFKISRLLRDSEKLSLLNVSSKKAGEILRTEFWRKFEQLHPEDFIGPHSRD